MIEGGTALSVVAGWKCDVAVATANGAMSLGLRRLLDEPDPGELDVLLVSRELMEFAVSAGCPLSALGTGISFIYDRFALPGYDRVIDDPPSDRFHEVFLPTTGRVPELRDRELPHRLERSLNEYHQVMFDLYSSLWSIAVSTDRLAGAMDAGDPVGTTLQVQAILLNLESHSLEAAKALDVLEDVGDEIEKYNARQSARGLPGFDLSPEILEEVQDLVRASGIPLEAESFLRDQGLTDEALAVVIEEFLEMRVPEQRLTHILRDLRHGLREVAAAEDDPGRGRDRQER